MNLTEIREGALKEVFTSIETAFKANGTDFYLIGALARDVWYTRADKSFRRTKDVDFAVLVSSQQEYLAIKTYLKEKEQFQDSKENAFVMFAPSGVQVDILPFGEIAIDDSIHFKGEGLTSIKVNGFAEVYETGTATLELLTGHHFKVATLSSIILLKLIAFDDRPENRSKDARDIASIIDHFFELQADKIYENHLDLFTDSNDEKTLQEISSIVIGREIKQICASNHALLDRVKKILDTQIHASENSIFIQNMVEGSKKNIEECKAWLTNMIDSFNK